jgi:hypothetical protein
MTTITSRRAILAGAAALPALAIPAAAAIAAPSITEASDDPIFHAIANHRRLNEVYSGLTLELCELQDRLPDAAHREPCVALYPERGGKAVMIEKSADHFVIRHDDGPVIAGKYHYANTIRDIERSASDIPEEHREVWLADRIRAFRADKRKVARARRKAGITQLEKRENAASSAEYEARENLTTTVPTTIAGTHALVSYLLEIERDGIIEEYGDALKTVQSALAAHVGKAVQS